MYTTTLRISALSAICALALISTTVAFAQDSGVSAEASAQAQIRVQPIVKPRPLQILHDTRLQLKADARQEIGGLKGDAVQIRMDAKADVKNASSGPERREILRGAQAEFKANIKERLQALFRTHLGSLIARLNAALQHFDNLVARIESRIEKLQEQGVNTVTVEASLSSSVGFIATAKADVQALSSLLSSVSDTSDAASVKAEIRAAVKKATESVKAAHRALLETAKQLTALVRASVEINSETSVDVNN